MQESRLFKIVYHLLDKGKATAVELAERFEVSVRTIYRDIDALSEAGVPVYTEAGRNGGIYLMKDFVLDQAVFSEEEKLEIFTALQSISAAQNTVSSETLQKLSAVFHYSADGWLEVDFSRWGCEYDNEKFELLKSAVIRRKQVKIFYAGSGEAAGERIIQPLKLWYKSKAWYLKAFCTAKQDYRVFKLNRILDLEILQEGFSYREYPKQADIPEQTYQTIRLRFPKEMAYRVYDEFDGTQVAREENGDLTVCARMPQDAWLTGLLLSFGTQAQVLEPASLREAVAQQAKQIYEKNFLPHL